MSRCIADPNHPSLKISRNIHNLRTISIVDMFPFYPIKRGGIWKSHRFIRRTIQWRNP